MNTNLALRSKAKKLVEILNDPGDVCERAQINENLEESPRALVNQGVGQGRQGNAPQPNPQPHVSHLYQASSRPQHQASRRSQPNQSPNPKVGDRYRDSMIHSAFSRPRGRPVRSVSKSPKNPSSSGRLGIVKNITPFSQEIMNTPISPKVKIPTLDPYDGKTDPTNHLNAYKAHMGVQIGCEASWCRFFPTTLKGIAYTWFNNLTTGSIRTFDMLATQFKKHFIAGSRQTKTSVHIMTDNVAFTALLFGLKSNKLKFEFVHDKVSTFSEAMELKGSLKLVRAHKGYLRSLEEPIYDIGTLSSTPKDPLMVFRDANVKNIQRSHDDPPMIHMKVANSKVKKILVDSGSLADIITWKCIEQMRFGRGDLTLMEKPLVGFGGQHVYPLGTIKLPVCLGEKKKRRSLVHTLLFVDTPLP
uniref:Retrotransposon gag domain-containing protein n=1 Tax=Chenopodium quinoa TaxID=63459 RepID=A0A803MT92_CHEQI